MLAGVFLVLFFTPAVCCIVIEALLFAAAANSFQPSAAGQPAAAATSGAAGTQTRAGGAAAEGAGVPGAEAAASSDPTQMFTSLLQAFGSQLNGAMTGQQPQTIYDVLVALGETHTPGQGELPNLMIADLLSIQSLN